ncbi:glycosyltransferase family 32 protein [Oceanobacillus sp. CF4.6]|uniref:glycosyltransferase family 32 protein n=1 Tax=Oceanobacillus sp. CF4.6 TaxID=3373080 RepID=UPI003EE62B0C
MNKNKIPKRIHYCWFGGKEKSDLIKRFIESWEVKLPDYEIIEWNERNFNLDDNKYAKEAYTAKKYAFVSDYVRVHALYHHGGIYLDTDVEVFKSFDDLLHLDSFWGFEQEDYIATSTIGAAKGNKIVKTFLDSYRDARFINDDGSFNELTNVAKITQILEELGIEMTGDYQELPGVGSFFPQEYFSPYDYINCRNFMTDHTYTMHHFYQSWLSPKARAKGYIKLVTSKLIGGENIARVRKIISKS